MQGNRTISMHINNGIGENFNISNIIQVLASHCAFGYDYDIISIKLFSAASLGSDRCETFFDLKKVKINESSHDSEIF